MESISEDMNQPLCWSEPSRYMSASLPLNSGRVPTTVALVEPESNQTSRVSGTFCHLSASAPRSSLGSRSHQAWMPDFSTRFAISSMRRSVSGWSSPVSLFTKRQIGTPQVRWREMHQSGRVATIASMRFCPHDGIHCTPLMASRDFSRRCCALSMLMNHCGVARKMIGVLWRQQWG